MPKLGSKSGTAISGSWSSLNFFLTILIVSGSLTSSGLFVLLLLAQPNKPYSINRNFDTNIQQRFTSSYNVVGIVTFLDGDKLQNVVDEVVRIVDQKGLPTTELSVTIIDLNNPEGAIKSGYRNREFRFPASVTKLFWMVMLYGELKADYLKNEGFYNEDLYKMIQKSDNEAASRIVDQITETTSGKELSTKEYEAWLKKRKQINNFFQSAGYLDLDISQKNFPIPYLRLSEPSGRELQMRGNIDHPNRNKMTTDQAARLMYEIFTNQAVSVEYSQKMQHLLLRDLRPEVWKKELYNSVKGFLGESLPYQQIYFASKVGWTSTSRQEVAFIASKDGKARYILTIFGDHPAYANDWEIFPKLSHYVFNRMR